jgi:formate-dependent nitrite reductase membrane component NrfD
MGFGAVATLWVGVLFLRIPLSGVFQALLLIVGSMLAALTAGYTGWLFAQAKGRVLWMRRGLWAHLIVQAVLAGSALAVVCTGAAGEESALARVLLGIALPLHMLFVLGEARSAPRGRESEYARAMRVVHGGRAGRMHTATTLGLGIVGPTLLLLAPFPSPLHVVGALLVLFALWAYEDFGVRVGQALPIS